MIVALLLTSVAIWQWGQQWQSFRDRLTPAVISVIIDR